MRVTRKQKNKARSSREADMISDLKNMDVMIRSSHYERREANFAIQSGGMNALAMIRDEHLL